MKAIALTFDLDNQKMRDAGRYWADGVYGTDPKKTFEYSAASYATFVDKNPTIPLTIWTNDVSLMSSCMRRYRINHDNVNYIDFTDQIRKSKEHKFTFQPLVDWLLLTDDPDEYQIRIDNDLIWLSGIDTNSIDKNKDVLVWKFERWVRDGDPRMGEQLVCEVVCGTKDFREYNVGVFGYPKKYPMKEFYDVCNQMVEVDILPVSDLGVSIWHVCEQTAQCWICHQQNYNMIETHHFVEHWYENKLKCIERASYLLL